MSNARKIKYTTDMDSTTKLRSVTQEKDIDEPGPGEVLVEVHAAALNPLDWKIHDYDFFISEYPAILGSDAAGVVKKVGEGVTNVVVGDRMYVSA